MRKNTQFTQFILLIFFLNSTIASTAEESFLDENSIPIENLSSLAYAFTHGFEANWQEKGQRDAFHFYRTSFFGEPTTALSNDTDTALIAEHQRGVRPKMNFKTVEIKEQEMVYPVSSALNDFIKRQTLNAGKRKQLLFNVGGDKQEWKKILGYSDSSDSAKRSKKKERQKSDRNEEKKRAEEAHQAFMVWLDQKIPPEERAFIGGDLHGHEQRAIRLFEFLKSRRAELVREKKDEKLISLALVDIINIIGHFNDKITQDLKSPCGKERIAALKRLLTMRDSFAMKLGFKRHFAEVLETYPVRSPSGLAFKDEFEKQLEKLEIELQRNTQQNDQIRTRWMRLLSVTESPFRSCIGGSDCSSRTYLTTALDPNFHYFAITDENFQTSGHITVVLGTARHQNKETLVAFVDKIQNISYSDLPAAIAAVNESVKELGYIIAVPVDRGDLNGISNDQHIQEGIAETISLNKNILFTDFSPSSHGLSYPRGYSRAYSKLPCHPIMESATSNFTVTRIKTPSSWRISQLNFQQLVDDTIKLKDGDTDAKIRYVQTMQKLPYDKEYKTITKKWMKDNSQPLKLRKQILIIMLLKEKFSFFDALEFFNTTEQLDIINTIFSTPSLNKIIPRKIDFIPYIFSVNKKYRQKLINRIFGSDKIYKSVFQESLNTFLRIAESTLGKLNFNDNECLYDEYLINVKNDQKNLDLLITKFFPQLKHEVLPLYDPMLSDDAFVSLRKKISYLYSRFDQPEHQQRDANYWPTLQNWMDDPSERSIFRNYIFFTMLHHEKIDFFTQIKKFSRTHQAEIFNLIFTREEFKKLQPPLDEIISFILSLDEVSRAAIIPSIFGSHPVYPEIFRFSSEPHTLNRFIKMAQFPAFKDLTIKQYLFETRNHQILRDFFVRKFLPNSINTIEKLFDLALNDEDLLSLLDKIDVCDDSCLNFMDKNDLLIFKKCPDLAREYINKRFREHDRDLVEDILYDNDLPDSIKLKAIACLENQNNFTNLENTPQLAATDLPRLHALVVLRDHPSLRTKIIQESFAEDEQKIKRALHSAHLSDQQRITALYIVLNLMTNPHWFTTSIAQIIFTLKKDDSLKADIIKHGFATTEKVLECALADLSSTEETMRLLILNLWKKDLSQDSLKELLAHARDMTTLKEYLMQCFIASLTPDAKAITPDFFNRMPVLPEGLFKTALNLLTYTAKDNFAASLVAIAEIPDLVLIKDWFIEKWIPTEKATLNLLFDTESETIDNTKIDIINCLINHNNTAFRLDKIESIFDEFRRVCPLRQPLIDAIRRHINNTEDSSMPDYLAPGYEKILEFLKDEEKKGSEAHQQMINKKLNLAH